MTIFSQLFFRECPSPPRNVVAFFSSSLPECSNNVNVSWEASSTIEIDNYFIECISDVDSFNTTVNGETRTVLFGNLSTPLVEYNCSVEAINSAGSSEAALAPPFVTE